MEKIKTNKNENSEKLSLVDKIKIFCEIISVLIIGVLSVYIGFHTNHIAQAELELAQAQNLAQFIVNEESVYDNQGIVNNRVVKISCQNGYFTNYQSNIFTILYIFCDDGQTYKIPMIGYWYVYMKTGNIQGLVETISASDNHKKYNEIVEVLKSSHKKIIDINMKHFMSISYYDFTQTKQVRFYEVVPISGTTIIEESKFKEEKEYYGSLFQHMDYLDIDCYTLDDIKEIGELLNINANT